MAQGLSIRLFASGGAYWPLATAYPDPLWARTCFGCVNGDVGGGGGAWHKASVSDCLPLAAPIGLSPLLILTLCGPERVLVVSTEPPDDLSCWTTPGVGGGGGRIRCQVNLAVGNLAEAPGFCVENPKPNLRPTKSPPPPCNIPSGCCFFTGALDSHPFFPSHVASGRCVLSAAAAGAPAGVVSAFAEPRRWCAGAVRNVAGCAVCAPPHQPTQMPLCAPMDTVARGQASLVLEGRLTPRRPPPPPAEGRAWDSPHSGLTRPGIESQRLQLFLEGGLLRLRSLEGHRQGPHLHSGGGDDARKKPRADNTQTARAHTHTNA